MCTRGFNRLLDIFHNQCAIALGSSLLAPIFAVDGERRRRDKHRGRIHLGIKSTPTFPRDLAIADSHASIVTTRAS